MSSSQLNAIMWQICAIILFTTASYNINAQLFHLNDCNCPGSVTTYECTVFGDGFTAWQGSAFDCVLSGNEILLSHNDFDDGTTRTCNDGAIIGRSVRIMGNYYTSQLSVNFTSGLDGRSIQCMSAGGNRAAVTVGSSKLMTTTDPLPSPSDVSLLDANPKLLTFKWSPVATNCSAVTYITEFDCGTCTNNTGLTSVNCSIDVPITSTSQSCEFAVKSIVCGNSVGNGSNIVSTILKVPDPPIITKITSIYSGDAQKRLLNVHILFSKVASFVISDGINVSPLYYTVTYFDGQTNFICGFDNISSSSCQQGVCTSSLPLSCYRNSGAVNISISATNVLGNGLASSVSIGTKDEYVDINFESATRVVCEFHNQDEQSNKLCAITYGQCQQPLNMTTLGNSTDDSPNIVRLELHRYLQNYCYTIHATNGSFTVITEGIYSPTDDKGCIISTSGECFTAVIVTLVLNLSTFSCCCLIGLCCCIISDSSTGRRESKVTATL